MQEHTDYFGNHVISFAIESLHRQLVVNVASHVNVEHQTIPDSEDRESWEHVSEALSRFEDQRWYEAQEFVNDSPRIRRGSVFADYAKQSFTAGRPILESTLDLTKRINDQFKYDTTATHVDSTTEEAFETRAGVCQDFAHIQIACLRSIGLPARYVSGYLKTEPVAGTPRLIGADESHAWISLYAGERLGWIDFDPTNACLANINHIPICRGRDYSDVSPMRGVVLGGGTTELSVSVDVESIEM